MRDESLFYDLSPSGMADSCQAGAVTFPGLLDSAAIDAFDAGVATGHSLRYPSDAVTLAAGGSVTVDGDDYRVVGVPRQINRDEMRAQLARVA